jgi:hypothetical protein
MKKGSWITIVIIIGIVAISYYAINKSSPMIEDAFASCIAENAVLYMQPGCFVCQKQEEVFGEGYSLLNKVDCSKDITSCAKEGVDRTPTWIINYEKHLGYKTLKQLSELTGCELNFVQNGTG